MEQGSEVAERTLEDQAPAERPPSFVFDGDCGFCLRAVLGLQSWTGPRVFYVPYQKVRAQDLPPGIELDPDECARAVHLVEPDGRVTRAAEACFRATARAPGRRWVAAPYRGVPGLAPVSEALYAFGARHRVGFGLVARLLSGPDPEPATYLGARRAFLALLGLAFLAAFLSLGRQVDGLIGSGGIMPLAAADWRLDGGLGAAVESIAQRPTLCWIDQSDGFLRALCAGGTAVSAFLIVGIAPRLSLLLALCSYLSLVTVAGVFCGYQWDGLLLETGLLALFLAPPGLLPGARWSRRPSAGFLLLLRFLLFRLMFSSGAVKLSSGDETWRSLTALDYHYWTQPLPSFVSYWADRLPAGVHEVSTAAMLAVELGLPFCLFGPRRLRLVAFLGFAMLQVAIFATGNYGFFNLLTLALCVLVLDDQTLRARLPAFLRRQIGPIVWQAVHPLRRAAVGVLALAFFALGGTVALETLHADTRPARPLRAALDVLEPFRVVNHYGLFATMTTKRPELVIEGSDDGERWREYEFKYKPGDVDRAPPLVGLHMPRLDWQMWFAALRAAGRGGFRPWFEGFLVRLLEGTPAVRDLMAPGPFDEAPPRFVRVRLYLYEFARPQDDARRGTWWRREAAGATRPFTLVRGRLEVAG